MSEMDDLKEELEKLKELAEKVKCGHKACRELVKAIKQTMKRKEEINAQ
jgi:Zn ribbon nucleic-acid-binding protein